MAEQKQTGGESAGAAKALLDAAEREMAHAQQIGKTQGLIALGALLQCARIYVAELEEWAGGLGNVSHG